MWPSVDDSMLPGITSVSFLGNKRSDLGYMANGCVYPRYPYPHVNEFVFLKPDLYVSGVVGVYPTEDGEEDETLSKLDKSWLRVFAVNIPVLFSTRDIIWRHTSVDTEVKAFRFPTKSEAEKLAERIFDRSICYEVEDLERILKNVPHEAFHENITIYMNGFPFYEDGEFSFIVEK